MASNGKPLGWGFAESQALLEPEQDEFAELRSYARKQPILLASQKEAIEADAQKFGESEFDELRSYAPLGAKVKAHAKQSLSTAAQVLTGGFVSQPFGKLPGILGTEGARGIVGGLNALGLTDKTAADVGPAEETPLYRAGMALEQGVREIVPPQRGYEDSVPAQIVGGVASLAPALAFGGLGGTGGMFASSAIQNGVAGFEEARLEGATEGDADQAFWVNALGGGALDTLSLNRLVGGFRKLKQAGGRDWGKAAREAVMGGAAPEAATGFLQQGLADLNARYSYDPDLGWVEIGERALKAGALEGAVGLIAGAGSGVAGAALGRGHVAPEAEAEFDELRAMVPHGTAAAQPTTDQGAPPGFPGQFADASKEVAVPAAAPAEPGTIAGTAAQSPPAPAGEVGAAAASVDPLEAEMAAVPLVGESAGMSEDALGRMFADVEGAQEPTRTPAELQALISDAQTAEALNRQPSEEVRSLQRQLEEGTLSPQIAAAELSRATRETRTLKRETEEQQRRSDTNLAAAEARLAEPAVAPLEETSIEAGGPSLAETGAAAVSPEEHAALASFKAATRSEAVRVEPATPDEVWASEFASRHGQRLVVVEAGRSPIPALYRKGVIVLNRNGPGGITRRGFVFHEVAHALKDSRESDWVALTEDIKRSDPEGWAKAGADFAREWQAVGLDPAALTPALGTEEATSRYMEQVAGYLDQAFRDPDSLRQHIQARPGLWRSIVQALLRVFGKDSRATGLTELRKFAETEYERGIDPKVAATLALRIREGLDTLLADAKPEAQAQAASKPPKAPPPAAPKTPPARAPPAAEKRPTSIKNRRVDAELEEMGLPPAEHGERLSFEEANAKAEARMAKQPLAGHTLLEELKENERAISGEEVALLTRERNRLRLARADAQQLLIESREGGDTEAAAEAQRRIDKITTDFQSASDIVTRAGTKTAQGLALRRMEMKEDYSLAAMERDLLVASKGSKLTKEQSEWVASINERLFKAQEALDALDAQIAAKGEGRGTRRKAAASKARIDELYAELANQGAERFALQPAPSKKSTEPSAVSIKGKRIEAESDSPEATALEMIDDADISGADFGSPIRQARKEAEANLRELNDEGAAQEERVFYRKVMNALRSWEKQGAVLEGGTVDTGERFALAPARGQGDPEKARYMRDIVAELHTSLGEIGLNQAERERVLQRFSIPEESDAEAQEFAEEFAAEMISEDPRRMADRIAQHLGFLRGELRPGLDVPIKTSRDAAAAVLAVRRVFGVAPPAKLPQIAGPDTGERFALAPPRKAKPVSTLSAEQETEINDGTYTASAEFLEAKTDVAKDRANDALWELQRRAHEGGYQIPAKAYAPGYFGDARFALARDTQAVLTELASESQKLGEQDFGKWSEEVVTKAGEKVRPHLQQAWDSAKQSPALKAYKTRTARETERLKGKVAAGDFTKPERRTLELDAEALAARTEVEKIRREFNRGVQQERLKNRTKAEKALDVPKQIIDVHKAIKTAWDFSAVFRQGGFFAGAHPVKGLIQPFRRMLRATFSEAEALKIDVELRNRPLAALGERAKLDLTRHGDDVGPKEEAIRSRWSDKIPGVKASNRAYITFLNVQRAAMFDLMAQGVPGGNATLEQAKAIANMVNIATGRGNVGKGKLASFVHGTSGLLWAPRLYVSRFQLLLGQPLYRGDRQTRKLVAKEYARAAMSAVAFYTLWNILGDTDDDKLLDPTTPDFGKVKDGDIRLDPLAGLAQSTVLLGRITVDGFYAATGQKPPPSAGEGTWPTLMRFGRTKLSPTLGTVIDVFTGENVVYEKVTPKSAALEAPLPMSFDSIVDAMHANGIPKKAAFAALAITGMGLQRYSDEKKGKSKSRARALAGAAQ